MLRFNRRGSKPQRTEQISRKESVATTTVWLCSHVMVRAPRQNCLLRLLQKPLDMGMDDEVSHKEKQRSLCFCRALSFLFMDLTKHTHHSAWHTMHNVICGGAKLVDEHLEALRKANLPVTVIHGDKDRLVPMECSYNLKSKLPHADLKVINGRDHSTVILGREKMFTDQLEQIWFSSTN
ncbi:hypothetical protein GW17_00011915 [Ensete ventricosum]|nr:hypothetical protein GW17_00011915 [Ensete ventricosum]